VTKFKYLETTVTNQDSIHEDINIGLNACCHFVQLFFPSPLQKPRYGVFSSCGRRRRPL